MSEWLDSPEVVALQNEVARLKREILHLRSFNSMAPSLDFNLYSSANDAPETNLSVPTVALQMLVSWDSRRDERSGQYHIVGQARGKDGGFHLAYYTEDPRVYTKHAALDVLGELHQRVVRQLAEAIQKDRAS